MNLEEFIEIYQSSSFRGYEVRESSVILTGINLIHQEAQRRNVDFKVAQIKEKFGDLRFYWYLNEGNTERMIEDWNYFSGVVDMMEQTYNAQK